MGTSSSAGERVSVPVAGDLRRSHLTSLDGMLEVTIRRAERPNGATVYQVVPIFHDHGPIGEHASRREARQHAAALVEAYEQQRLFKRQMQEGGRLKDGAHVLLGGSEQ